MRRRRRRDSGTATHMPAKQNAPGSLRGTEGAGTSPGGANRVGDHGAHMKTPHV